MIKQWESKIAKFDKVISPFASEIVDINDSDWMNKLKDSPNPLDTLNIRTEVETILFEIIDKYPHISEPERNDIRTIFKKYPSFSCVAGIQDKPDNRLDFYKNLVLFSIKDQGKDSRDAMVHLHELCRKGREAGVQIEPVLKEVSLYSSDIDIYGMGSTKEMLLKAN